MNSTVLAAKKKAFLECLAETGQVTAACKHAGVCRETPYNWRKADPDFAAEWDKALLLGVDSLETEAFRRALAGSDTLLIFLLKGHKPERYRERYEARHVGDTQQPMQVSHDVAHPLISDALRRILDSHKQEKE